MVSLQKCLEMASPPISEPPKLSFCCIRLEPVAYVFHVINFVVSTIFVGFIFLFVADHYGWIDGMAKNEGGFWYSYFLKIVFCLLLIAVVQCLLSMAFASLMEKRAKFLFVYLTVMILLSFTVLLTIGITTMVRFEGSWFELSIALRDRLMIYGVWFICIQSVGRIFFRVKSAEEHERLIAVTADWPKSLKA
ncbi:hypothetical protein MSG28_004864 [Choristoneura fumiferana]|uniref:Uncharacterized protein n=1 Tax=Choristoneura fumiferana TaxID=7141 RepID=A0ACC0K8X9_CHOFU|nr:hypothetical protein MSG28_004864 [Choristoneura fumiferana]